DHREEGVAVLRAAGDVGGPVARIHVADGHEVARAGKGEDLSPPGAAGNGDAAVRFGEGRRVTCAPPPRIGCGGVAGAVHRLRTYHERILVHTNLLSQMTDHRGRTTEKAAGSWAVVVLAALALGALPVARINAQGAGAATAQAAAPAP